MELDEKFDREKQQIEQGEKVFNPKDWDPKITEKHREEAKETLALQKTSDAVELQLLSELDQKESNYIQEYNKLVDKDLEQGKDFNLGRLNQMKQAKYYFDFLRTQEKLIQIEMLKD